MANVLSPGYNLAMAGMYPDPSQWSNPYSQYGGGALPFPPGYVGTPTNAFGQPIQAAGTTVNTMPQTASPIQQDHSNQFGGTFADMLSQAPNLSQQQKISLAAGALPGGVNPVNAAYAAQLLGPSQPQVQSGVQPASVAGSYQNALNLLSNPGHVFTPGASVPGVLATSGGMPTGGTPYTSMFNMSGGRNMGGGPMPNLGAGIGGGSSMPFMSGNPSFFGALSGGR